MSDNDSFGAFVIGFLTGAILGGVAALLLAPQSGVETRKLIADKSNEVYHKAEKSLEETYAQAEASLAEARAKIESLAVEAKAKGIEIQEKGHIMLEQIAKKGETQLPAASE